MLPKPDLVQALTKTAASDWSMCCWPHLGFRVLWRQLLFRCDIAAGQVLRQLYPARHCWTLPRCKGCRCACAAAACAVSGAVWQRGCPVLTGISDTELDRVDDCSEHFMHLQGSRTCCGKRLVRTMRASAAGII